MGYGIFSPKLVLKCHICASKDNLTEIDVIEYSFQKFGLREWIPGLSSDISLCDNPKCHIAFERKAEALINKSFKNGHYE